jgi:hypothetical protein
MNKIIYSVVLIFLFASFGKYFAQAKYNVDYDEIKGKLTNTDKYKKDFGKYHGYELPLYEGETANFALHSNDFNARIILVNPEGKVFKQSNEPVNGFASIITPIPVSGDWILYVVGDQKDQGEFILRYAFADANSINTSSNMDFCSTINFIVAHANAHFMMLQTGNKNSLPKIPGSIESFIDPESGAFVNIIYSGKESQIIQQFKQNEELINNCLPDWKKINVKKSADSHAQFLNTDKIKIDLEYNRLKNQEDNYELILRITKDVMAQP